MATGCGVSSINEISPTAQSLGSAPVESSLAGGSGASDVATSSVGKPEVREAAAKLTAVSEPGNAAYKIGPLDVLDVSVFNVADLSKVVQVSEAGTVSLPLIGEQAASGKTPREFEQHLVKVLGAKYLQNPQVTVVVKEYNSQRITMEGAVKKPGVFPIQGRLSLLQAIAIAQGLESASDSTVVIFRTEGGKREAAKFDISEIRSGNASDPQLKAGDIVVAGTSAIKETFQTILKALPLTSVFLGII